jgi:hypothetical protein
MTRGRHVRRIGGKDHLDEAVNRLSLALEDALAGVRRGPSAGVPVTTPA